MNGEGLLAALDLPPESRVDRRVPKTMLTDNGAPTAADKRRISEGIESLMWVAALKPATAGIPEYRDASREYLEIAVLRLVLRRGIKAARVVELVHRAVPYPVLLVAEEAARVEISTAHKRRAQNEAGRTVLDDGVVAVEPAEDDEPWAAQFRAALALSHQPRASLHALYQGWMDTLIALQAARVTGVFRLSGDGDRGAARRAALEESERLEADIAGLRAAAGQATQIARRVELNDALKRAEAQLAAARQRL